ncbi:MAG TPA: UDP-glucose 4-epimerase [Myxococcales bacterium]|nr:UDP-glucose 4-epimerase [Deltaproteobacteria bacterium]MBU54172.1 UDP-glucose 4-epimerase [Deltaproteobacteria bacterium]HAA54116.1 UDP-glucose 4-epimerase [Myxococcales bacterium]
MVVQTQSILVTGGAGYVGAVLVPKLLEDGLKVRVVDLFLYGEDVLDSVKEHPGLTLIKGDIRDRATITEAVSGVDTVLHLACISNDPSFELNPELGKSINYDAFGMLVEESQRAGVRRFIYASSGSVYGLSDAQDVTEDHPLRPLTDYSKFKIMCEEDLLAAASEQFVPVIIRPATLCGYSPRLRLDLTVNILTTHAVERGGITVFGGTQKRPNLHIQDMVALYRLLLTLPDEKVAGKVYNAGYQNHTVADIAKIVKQVVEEQFPEKAPISIDTTPTDDLRSYHISSQKIADELGFTPSHNIEDAVRDLCQAFSEGKIPSALEDVRYYNVRLMKNIELV